MEVICFKLKDIGFLYKIFKYCKWPNNLTNEFHGIYLYFSLLFQSKKEKQIITLRHV
jgi:hypothetical protein